MKFVFTSLLSIVLLVYVNAAGVVINEIMYHPPGDADELQFIELHHAGPSAVEVSSWSLSRGVEFKVPEKTVMEPGSYAIVCRNPVAFSAHYGRQARVLGAFTGKLSHKGEKIELLDDKGHLMESVAFGTSPGWPSAADGGSGSLERICPTASASDSANWASSRLPEFQKSVGTPGAQNDS